MMYGNAFYGMHWKKNHFVSFMSVCDTEKVWMIGACSYKAFKVRKKYFIHAKINRG